MTNTDQDIGLGEAASRYLADLPPEQSATNQQEVFKFIRWFGREKLFGRLTPAEIDNFGEQLSRSDIDYARKFELIKKFLTYGKKKGWSRTNLSTHLKIKKGKTKSSSPVRKVATESVSMTHQGYAELEAELEALRKESYQVIDEIKRAAADKDFRENAPLHAARERRGHLEGRIMELEGILKSAAIVDESKEDTQEVGVGDSVVLIEVDSDTELRYTLVSPREVDPARGKISSASPVGRAIIGRKQGETVEITAPVGKLHYRIQRIEH